MTWRAYELRPPEAPPLPEHVAEASRKRIDAGRERMHAYARDVFGVEMGNAKHGISSRLAHQAAKFAAAHGAGDAYRRALFAAHWQQARDISDMSTLRSLAAECGLDPDALQTALEQGQYLQDVLSDAAEAQDLGLSGVPAFIFAGQYLVTGAQPPETMARVANLVREKLSEQAIES